jgi:hypothetical protein
MMLFLIISLSHVYSETCNVPQFRPEDILRRLYGYACGEAITTRSCRAPAGTGTGKCVFGPKNRDYALDTFRELDVTNPGVIVSFGNWLIAAMVQAYSLHVLCLNADPNACTDTSADPIFRRTSDAITDAITEISANVEASVSCTCRCKRIELVGFEPYDGVGGGSDEAEITAFQINGVTVSWSPAGTEKRNDCMSSSPRKSYQLFPTGEKTNMIPPGENPDGSNIFYSTGKFGVGVQEANGICHPWHSYHTISKIFAPHEWKYDEYCLREGDTDAEVDIEGNVYIPVILTLDDDNTKVQIRVYDESDTSQCSKTGIYNRGGEEMYWWF